MVWQFPRSADSMNEQRRWLGVTTIVFATTGASVTETLPKFSGSYHSDPCDFCEIDIVGMFSIPSNATGATISGTFGNSCNSTSAGVDVCIRSGAVRLGFFCSGARDVRDPRREFSRNMGSDSPESDWLIALRPGHVGRAQPLVCVAT